jgi:DNA repair and recombination RAD54-like protein
MLTLSRQRPRSVTLTITGKESTAALQTPGTQRITRPYAHTPQSTDRLIKPFRCPGSATPLASRSSDKPARKRRKVNYAGADGGGGDDDAEKPYSNEDRLALATRDINRFPVFKARDKETAMRSRFAVPLINKSVEAYSQNKPPPLLGLRTGAVFVARPLHDPSGEFAIVLYDPTVDDVQNDILNKGEEEFGHDTGDGQKQEVIKLDRPVMHKSLAEILGIKKENKDERPKVPVVIDPRLAKVLRPHQIEGVKVSMRIEPFTVVANSCSSCIAARLVSLTLRRTAASWLMRWVSERRCSA